MINPPYEGATEEHLRNPYVRDLLAIHNMFRSRLQAIIRYIDKLMSGEKKLDAPETRNEIISIIQAGSQYSQMLHMHHTIETATLFPRMEAEGLDTSIIDKLNSDHDEIGVLIDRFADAIQELSSVQPEVLKHDLRRLSDALHQHLAYEETHVCPYLAHVSNLH